MDIVQGARLWWIVASLCIGLLLSSLESTIVATSLVSIGSDFDDFEQSNGVIVFYLLTYSSFLFIFASFSDHFGRRVMLQTGLILFTVFSLACGLARSLRQLIVFRAFQGIGGAGIYALSLVISAEISPPERFGPVSGLIGMVFATASAIGPLIGGVITSSSTWRWCFLLNVPSGFLVILLNFLVFPKNAQTKENTKTHIRRIDILGSLLCLAGSVVIIIPLEEGGVQAPWSSPLMIALFTLGGTFWLAFAGWETWLAQRTGESVVVPMLPIQVLAHRVIGACMLIAFFTGITFTATIVNLPQRFQVVHDRSPVDAGIDMLTLVVVSALAFTATGIMLSKRNICAYLIAFGTALQVAGLGLNSSLPSSPAIHAADYGYQVLTGVGFGVTLSSSFVLARIEVRREDIASTVGVLSQLRVFGGVLGVAICRVILSSYVRDKLAQVLSVETLQSVLSSTASINQLPGEQQAGVRRVYGNGFAQQSRILLYIAAASFLVSPLTFRRHAKPLKENTSIPSPAERSDEEATMTSEKAADEASGSPKMTATMNAQSEDFAKAETPSKIN